MATKANSAVVRSYEEDQIDYTSEFDDDEDPEDEESDESTGSAVERSLMPKRRIGILQL